MTDSPLNEQDRSVSYADIQTVSQLRHLLEDVEDECEIGVCIDTNGHVHYTIDVGAFEVPAEGDSINLAVGRYANGTKVIVIQDEDGDGDPPRPPFEAVVVGYDISTNRYELVTGRRQLRYSEPASTVHPVYELLAPAIRAAVRDWNAKITFDEHRWVADCEASRGMSYRGTWQTSLLNYGQPVSVNITKEG